MPQDLNYCGEEQGVRVVYLEQEACRGNADDGSFQRGVEAPTLSHAALAHHPRTIDDDRS